MFRPTFRVVALSAAGAMLAATAVFAASHGAKGPHAAAIKARQSQMQLYAFNLGQLGAMAKGEVEYNSEVATAAAANLATMTRLNAMAMWPAGSDNAQAANTRALPDLWQNFADVASKAEALSAAADTMASAAGTDLMSLQAAMGPLGGACGACHKAYRAEE